MRSVVYRRMLHSALAVLVTMAAACQRPTDADSAVDIDDILVTGITPQPATADASNDGKTYRVVRGNNQPDDILAYDWKTSFAINLHFNDAADDEDALAFPVTLSSATLRVQQASGGIVTAPTGGDTEHFDYVTSASSNSFGAIGATVNLVFDVWYDLPSLRKEALVTVTLGFVDDDGRTFTKTLDVKVAP